MGAGHLNAKRAVDQHAAGEQPPGSVDDMGWDFFFQNDPFQPNRYSLSLNAGDYVSATLVWDREIFIFGGFDEYQRGDEFLDFGFDDLNLYLVPAGFPDVPQGIANAVASSVSTAWNLEHFFASVPTAGNYEIWVMTDAEDATDYALAWWAGADMREETPPGDHNGDGSVDGADYVAWRKNPTAFGGDPGGYDEWRTNFGSTSGAGALASVPEPGGFALAMMLIGGVLCGGRDARMRA
jgi:hypothetical protein